MNEDSDLDRELQAHLDLEAAEQSSSGLPPDQARHAARRTLGNTTRLREQIHELSPWTRLQQLLQDLRYAVRNLRRSPGFTAVALLALGLGIGANTAIFSFVSSVLLRPLAFRDPGRLMMLDEKWLPRFTHFEATPLDFLGWREQSRAFSELSAYVDAAFNLAVGDRPERILGATPSASAWTSPAPPTCARSSESSAT
jgi:putative ABC transport system permease protein